MKAWKSDKSYTFSDSASAGGKGVSLGNPQSDLKKVPSEHNSEKNRVGNETFLLRDY